ncbi:Protein-S-isoprenylcysteine O-methyltransferase Ste14 [Aureimonas altamirensis DSM 21988]|uniref:Protein-S-isoprenylcysteine O-methyltransferase Ste14 n=1 Tax=Aureimonas altamirensis DSM 21988 TaxID=1121026 RepID=A0ABY1I6H6_9HYPH|nr:isoprenylcysteine carboxylmethyltransferase family protein [Aureimonas altamirensis]SHI57286.1 Protein-S-isoprenylcysteine O-methyltransferase Ste14 [Aureimonas altamirensis DSM 21988]
MRGSFADDTLSTTQLRRKRNIRFVFVMALPFFLIASGPWSVGSWQREGTEHFGMMLIIVAILGRSWCTLYIGGRKVRQLVTVGPYSLTRNPLYLFSLLAVVGIAAQTGSLAISAISAFLTIAIFMPVIQKEEAELLRLHGRRFELYRLDVPRFVPRLSNWTDAAELAIDPDRWRRTVLDSLVFLFLVSLLRGIGHVQEAFGGALLTLW